MRLTPNLSRHLLSLWILFSCSYAHHIESENIRVGILLYMGISCLQNEQQCYVWICPNASASGWLQDERASKMQGVFRLFVCMDGLAVAIGGKWFLQGVPLLTTCQLMMSNSRMNQKEYEWILQSTFLIWELGYVLSKHKEFNFEIVWLMLVLFLSTGTHQNSFLHVLQSLVLQGIIFSESIYLWHTAHFVAQFATGDREVEIQEEQRLHNYKKPTAMGWS